MDHGIEVIIPKVALTVHLFNLHTARQCFVTWNLSSGFSDSSGFHLIPYGITGLNWGFVSYH